jgi:hypothetical protein
MRLDALETRGAADRSNMLAALTAQAAMVDTGFEEVRSNQAAAVAGLHHSLSHSITMAITAASAQTESSLATMMAMMRQATGIQDAQAPSQIGNGAQPQIGNGAATPGSAPGLQQITLAGSNFAAQQAPLLAPPPVSEAYAASRARVIEAMQLAGAPAILDASSDPLAGPPAPGSMGPPQ